MYNIIYLCMFPWRSTCLKKKSLHPDRSDFDDWKCTSSLHTRAETTFSWWLEGLVLRCNALEDSSFLSWSFFRSCDVHIKEWSFEAFCQSGYSEIIIQILDVFIIDVVF